MRSQWLMVFLFAAATAFGQTQQQLHVVVPLDETGISEWTFLNPKLPRPLGTDQSLVFTNETANRTFVVTIPFEFRTEDFATAYTTASVTAPATLPTNVRLTMPTYVSRVLRRDSPVCTAVPSQSPLCELEFLKMLREDVNGLKGEAKAVADLRVPRHALLTTDHLEGLYWTAVCNTPDTPPDDQRKRLGAGEDDPPELRKQLKIEAEALVQRVLGAPQVLPPRCDMNEAIKNRDKITADLFQRVTDPPVTFEDRTRIAARSRFATARTSIAKTALLAAIDAAIASAYTNAGTVLSAIDQARSDLDKLTLDKDVRDCEIRLLRTAATLVATYGPGSKVPFDSPALDNDPAVACGRTTAAPARYGTKEALSADDRRVITSGNLENVGFEIADCTGEGKTMCVARATIPPKQRAVFSRSILERRSDKRVQFLVAFFDEAEPPSNATGYAFLSSFTRTEIATDPAKRKETLPSQTPEKLVFNFAGDAGTDYALPKGQVDSHIRRSSGAASLGFQYIGPYDLSATLQFKKGELAGAASTNQVQATQYQAKVFGPAGTVLEYGRFVFARPSSSIALSEFGEGLRFSFPRANLGYMFRRQSDNPRSITTRGNEDSYVLIGQYNPAIPFLRSFLLTATWGNDKGAAPPEKNPNCIQNTVDNPLTPEVENPGPALDPCSVAHTYATGGFDAKFPISSNISGSIAAYHSVRHIRNDTRIIPPAPPGTTPNFAPTVDGKGDVALLTVSWSRLVEQSLLKPLEQAKPSFSLTGFLGYGSADDPDSTDRNESYLGETAGFANDKLFLSSLAGTKKVIGPGLSNKWYAGLQYSNARWSPLQYVAALFKASDEVQSTSTVVTLHKYQFIRDLNCATFPKDNSCNDAGLSGARNAGFEVDVDFLIETPKNVRWSLGGGWYRTSRAVEAVGVTRNPWVVLANVSLKFNAR